MLIFVFKNMHVMCMYDTNLICICSAYKYKSGKICMVYAHIWTMMITVGWCV